MSYIPSTLLSDNLIHFSASLLFSVLQERDITRNLRRIYEKKGKDMDQKFENEELKIRKRKNT
ncbi:hypothetical protein RhiirB3_457672 [Rhizophagus irregularis]|nr:hypothetical protein RhiirB3_457672 [Rhizophagus irregularis]